MYLNLNIKAKVWYFYLVVFSLRSIMFRLFPKLTILQCRVTRDSIFCWVLGRASMERSLLSACQNSSRIPKAFSEVFFSLFYLLSASKTPHSILT